MMQALIFSLNQLIGGFHQIHLNALFDLCEKRYIDLVIQPARLENESLAMTQMIDRYKGEKKNIFIADRGYETYNIFAHVQEKGMYYLDSCKGWRWGKHDRKF